MCNKKQIVALQTYICIILKKNLHLEMTTTTKQENSNHFNATYPGRLGLADFT